MTGGNLKFKGLPNRPGSAALGPVGTVEVDPTSVLNPLRENSRLHLQYIPRSLFPVTHTDKSVGCSYAPYNETSRLEFDAMTGTDVEFEACA